MAYVTKSHDTDLYMTDFIPVHSLVDFSRTCKILNQLVCETKIYQELLKLERNQDVLYQCYQKGLIRILQRLQYNNINIFGGNLVGIAAANGHIHILDWIYQMIPDYGFWDWPLVDALVNNQSVAMEWFFSKGLDFGHFWSRRIDLITFIGDMDRDCTLISLYANNERVGGYNIGQTNWLRTVSHADTIACLKRRGYRVQKIGYQ